MAVCFLFSLNGCYQAQRQPATPAGVERGGQQGSAATGPFGEQIPDQTRKSPFEQQQTAEPTENPLESEISGTMKPPALKAIDSRISEYNRKIAQWHELENAAKITGFDPEAVARMGGCYQDLQKILNGYNTLRTAVVLGDSSNVAENSVYSSRMQLLMQDDIQFLEGDCGSLLSGALASAGQQVGPAGGQPQEAEIAALAAKMDYKGLEFMWSQIPENQRESFSLKTKMLYAEALIYLQKEEQAAEVYRRIIEQMTASAEKSADPLALRKTLADLYVATGNFVEAQKQYEMITKDYLDLADVDNWAKVHLAILGTDQKDSLELPEYSGLVRNYLGYMPEQDGYRVVWDAEKFIRTYPGSPVLANVEAIRIESQELAEKWFNDFMAEVNQLAAEKKFQEAMAKIKGMRTDIINDLQVDLLNAKNDELVLAKAVELETAKMTKLQELDQKWNNGLMLAKAGRYDEAIAVFNGMNETDYAAKAETKIKEISDLAAKDDRRKAADLFIRFTKTTDIESKKKLLIESRRLLKDILVKYPRVDITDKVLSNIQRVEQEMNAIDPQLISTVDSQASAPAPQQEAVPEQQPVTVPEDAFEPQPPIVESPLQQ